MRTVANRAADGSRSPFGPLAGSCVSPPSGVDDAAESVSLPCGLEAGIVGIPGLPLTSETASDYHGQWIDKRRLVRATLSGRWRRQLRPPTPVLKQSY